MKRKKEKKMHIYKVNIGNTCSFPIDVTLKREKEETFSLNSAAPLLTTDYNDRIFTFRDGSGKIMEYVLSNGYFEVDETGLRDKDNPAHYYTKWNHEYKIYIDFACSIEVTVKFFRDKLDTYSSTKYSRIETDYNQRVFKFRNSAGKVMEFFLSNGHFEVDEIGLRSKSEPTYYFTKWETARSSASTLGKVNKVMSLEATAYGNNHGWGNKTAMGGKCHADGKYRTVAVDKKVIPLGTKVRVSGYKSPYLPKGGFFGIAEDTGVYGKKIDIYMEASENSHAVNDFGKQNVTVEILG